MKVAINFVIDVDTDAWAKAHPEVPIENATDVRRAIKKNVYSTIVSDYRRIGALR